MLASFVQPRTLHRLFPVSLQKERPGLLKFDSLTDTLIESFWTNLRIASQIPSNFSSKNAIPLASVPCFCSQLRLFCVDDNEDNLTFDDFCCGFYLLGENFLSSNDRVQRRLNAFIRHLLVAVEKMVLGHSDLLNAETQSIDSLEIEFVDTNADFFVSASTSEARQTPVREHSNRLGSYPGAEVSENKGDSRRESRQEDLRSLRRESRRIRSSRNSGFLDNDSDSLANTVETNPSGELTRNWKLFDSVTGPEMMNLLDMSEILSLEENSEIAVSSFLLDLCPNELFFDRSFLSPTLTIVLGQLWSTFGDNFPRTDLRAALVKWALEFAAKDKICQYLVNRYCQQMLTVAIATVQRMTQFLANGFPRVWLVPGAHVFYRSNNRNDLTPATVYQFMSGSDNGKPSSDPRRKTHWSAGEHNRIHSQEVSFVTRSYRPEDQQADTDVNLLVNNGNNSKSSPSLIRVRLSTLEVDWDYQEVQMQKREQEQERTVSETSDVVISAQPLSTTDVVNTPMTYDERVLLRLLNRLLGPAFSLPAFPTPFTEDFSFSLKQK